jgi:hypothetical protein
MLLVPVLVEGHLLMSDDGTGMFLSCRLGQRHHHVRIIAVIHGLGANACH